MRCAVFSSYAIQAGYRPQTTNGNLNRMTNPNAEAIEAWDTVLFDKFTRFKHLVTEGLGPHGTVAIDRLAPQPGENIIDLGCGFGDSTISIAAKVGATGKAVGVDAASRFIEAATKEAHGAGVSNVNFFAKDVQTEDLGGPYDAAFSRFGVMFFSNPVAALKNVRKSLKPNGRLCAVVWRKREDNDWLYTAQQLVESIVPPPQTHTAPTCGPGPFSMAGADMVSDQIQKAGFRNVAFERCDTEICIGHSLDEAIDFACALGPAGETLRLVGDRANEVRPQIVGGLKRELKKFERPDGTIWAPSSTWVIRAASQA